MHSNSIKHKVRDAFIFLISILGIAWLYRAIVGRHGPLVRIVVFHDVPDAGWFESMIITLTESFNVVTPHEFHTQAFHPTRINVLVTFDDGYRSWSDVAQPVLERRGVKALFFINSGLVDVAEDQSSSDAFMQERLRIIPRQALSWSRVQALVGFGHTIGGHARSHADLTTLHGELLMHELGEDKVVIERNLARAVTDFAYPFGTRTHVNGEVKQAIITLGYTHAYTAVSRFVTDTETFMIPRMCIETGQTPRSLKRWVTGAYDLFDMIKTICVR